MEDQNRPLRLCKNCRKELEERLSSSQGINAHVLALMLIYRGWCDIVEKELCDVCKAKRDIQEAAKEQRA